MYFKNWRFDEFKCWTSERIRKEKGLTQVQLADLIQYNEGTIANIENSSYQTFSLEFLYVISKKLKVPMSEFFKDID